MAAIQITGYTAQVLDNYGEAAKDFIFETGAGGFLQLKRPHQRNGGCVEPNSQPRQQILSRFGTPTTPIAMRCNALQCKTMPCNAMPCNLLQCFAISCNACQCLAMHSTGLQCLTISTAERSESTFLSQKFFFSAETGLPRRPPHTVDRHKKTRHRP